MFLSFYYSYYRNNNVIKRGYTYCRKYKLKIQNSSVISFWQPCTIVFINIQITETILRLKSFIQKRFVVMFPGKIIHNAIYTLSRNQLSIGSVSNWSFVVSSFLLPAWTCASNTTSTRFGDFSTHRWSSSSSEALRFCVFYHISPALLLLFRQSEATLKATAYSPRDVSHMLL